MSYHEPLYPYQGFPATAPDLLPVRQPGDSGGPEFVISASVAQADARGVTLAGVTQRGGALAVSVRLAAPGIVRVQVAGDEGRRVRLARDLEGAPAAVTVEQTESGVVLRSPEVRVEIDLEPFNMRFVGPDGRLLLAQNSTDCDATDRLVTLPLGFSAVDGQRVAFHDSFNIEPDEHFYGFGEQFTEFDKRGQLIEMWNYDAYGSHSKRAYKNVPFFISTRGYGVFVDSHRPVRFDMGHNNHALFSLIVPDAALDYYVIAGPDPKTVIARYADLVGHPTLPPKWAFGLWMSSGFKRDSADEVFARARELRDHDIPADVLHLDCYWQRFGRWSDNQWDLEMFPDPAALVQKAHAAGFKVCLWINPYIGVESPLLQTAIDSGYLLKTPAGEAWIGPLWGHYHPPVGIIDVTNPAAADWMRGLLRPHLEMGVDVYKTDFGEGVPAETVAHNGMTGVELHNLYPLLYNDLVAGLTAEVTGRAGLVWGRSTYAGGQRHAAQWSGDPACTYQGMASTLRGGLSLAMCGHAFWSHDIGGFHRHTTPELYTRWAQFGLFSPLARAHGVTTRLPWDFGEEAERIFRGYVRLRYSLLPYIYSCAVEACETGLPLLRPLALEFPDDPCTYTLDLQYMFGAELLVAPVYNSEGRRPVYFPAGRWVDWWTREIIVGPQTRFVQAPLDVLPLYVRANALIPTTAPVSHISEAPFDSVVFDAYLLERAAFTLRDTDGATSVSAALAGGTLALTAAGARRTLGLRLLPLPGAGAVSRVTVNGQALDRAAWSRGADGSLTVAVALP